MEPTQEIIISFAPHGFRRSPQLHLTSAETLLSEFKLAARSSSKGENDFCGPLEPFMLLSEDEAGLGINLEVQKAVRYSGARQLAVFCPFWIFNLTSVQLAIRDADSESSNEQPLPICEDSDAKLGLNRSGLQAVLSDPTEKSNAGLLVRSAKNNLEASKTLITHSHRSPVLESGEKAHGIISASCQEKLWGFPCGSLYSPPPQLPGSDSGDSKVQIRAVSGRRLYGGADSAQPEWSEPMLLDPPSGLAVVNVPQEGGRGAYVLAVSVLPAGGASQGITKSLTIRPRCAFSCASLWYPLHLH